MNRPELASMVVSGVQMAQHRVYEVSKLLHAEVSPVMSDYESPSYFRVTATSLRARAEILAGIVAELCAHAGMLDALSYVDAERDAASPAVAEASDVHATVARGAS